MGIGRGSTVRLPATASSRSHEEASLGPIPYVKGRWRSVTGDVDFLQITHADGSPLTDAERAKVYIDFSKSPVGMMHGESATWTYKGQFDFDKKVNEFVRSGINVQFGPDGEARGVLFDKDLSTFKTPEKYKIHWIGGYVVP